MLSAKTCTAVYVFVSFRLFVLTNALKEVVVPNKVGKEMTRNFVTLAVSAVLLFMAGSLVIRVSGFKDWSPALDIASTEPHFDP